MKEQTHIHTIKCYKCKQIIGIMAWNQTLSFYEKDSTNHYPNITELKVSKENYNGRFVCPKCYEEITGEQI